MWASWPLMTVNSLTDWVGWIRRPTAHELWLSSTLDRMVLLNGDD